MIDHKERKKNVLWCAEQELPLKRILPKFRLGKTFLALSPPTMADRQESVDKFTHDLAIELSQALNLTNPNDRLAVRVIQLAQNDKNFDKFVTGKFDLENRDW